MQKLRFFCFGIICCPFLASYAQSTAPNSRESAKKQVFFAPRSAKASKVRKINVKHTARYEFYERIEKAAKEKQRILRKMSKAHFSDPRYFGHKRLPRRKPVHKIRYCGECGIRH